MPKYYDPQTGDPTSAALDLCDNADNPNDCNLVCRELARLEMERDSARATLAEVLAETEGGLADRNFDLLMRARAEASCPEATP